MEYNDKGEIIGVSKRSGYCFYVNIYCYGSRNMRWQKRFPKYRFNKLLKENKLEKVDSSCVKDIYGNLATSFDYYKILEDK